MRSGIKSINIKEPCRQLWDDMLPEEGGRYCGSCSKIVVDFTRMSDSDIINYFRTVTNTCGRFSLDQLPRINRSLQQPRSDNQFWKKLGIAASIISLFSIVRVNAQPKRITHVNHALHTNRRKDATSTHRRTNPIYAKEIAAEKIIIDTNAKSEEIKNLDLFEHSAPSLNMLGGIVVGRPIKIRERLDSFISRSELFRY